MLWKQWAGWCNEGCPLARSDYTHGSSGRHGAVFTDYMACSRFFVTPRGPGEVAPIFGSSYPAPDQETLSAFVMPFDVCCVGGDSDSVSIVGHMEALECGEKRCLILTIAQLEEGADGQNPLGDNGSVATFSVCRARADSLHSWIKLELADLFWRQEDGTVSLHDAQKGDNQFIYDVAETAAGHALAFLIAVQSPTNFIVEEKAISPLRGKALQRTKVRNLSAKPIYLSLSAEKIRTRYELTRPSGQRGGHDRRAHLRRLTSNRYTFMQGQLVPVKACWVGPSSGKTPEGREYRVRLDLSSPHVVEVGDGDGLKLVPDAG